MKLGRRAEPFNDPAWLYELKWDGFRTLACIQDGHCELRARNGNRFRLWTCLSAALSRMNLDNAILDGETVCLDDQGRPVSKSLLFGDGTPVFYAFDLLWLNGQDLRGEPLLFRKDRLRQLIKRQPALPGQYLRYIDHIDGQDGKTFFDLCCSHDLEGVVAKRSDSTYLGSDQESAWLTIQNRNYSQAVERDELFERRTPGKASSPVPVDDLIARMQRAMDRGRELRAQLHKSMNDLSKTLLDCASTGRNLGLAFRIRRVSWQESSQQHN